MRHAHRNFPDCLPRTLLAGVAALLLAACGGSPPESVAQLPGLAAPAPVVPVVPVFAGKRNDYRITKTATGFSVTDLSGNVTAITDASALRFADVTVNLQIGDLSKTISASNLKTLIELYVAFFNRVPEADGLAYWIGRIRDGMTLDQMAASFYVAALAYSDLTGYSAAMSDADFVKIIYKNVLGRSGASAPPDADVAYWANQLAAGSSTKGHLVATMLNAAHTYAGDPVWGWVPQLLDNKISVATLFSVQQGLNYNTPQESISKGMAIAAAVTPTDINAATLLIGLSDRNFDLTAPVASNAFAAVQTIVNAHCIGCHSAQVANGGIALHTADLIRKNAGPLYIATVVTRAMPLSGTLSEAEIAAIASWYQSGAQ